MKLIIKNNSLFFLLTGLTLLSFTRCIYGLPNGFVYLDRVAPDILQEIRYAGQHNFIGRPIKSYDKPRCILTQNTAAALADVQKVLKKEFLSLKVYDCYRPVVAVMDFLKWSREPQHQEMKAEFFPFTNKKNLFKLEYIALRSGHSRGSSVDLTIVPVPAPLQPAYNPGQILKACTADYKKRYPDNSLDMGTGFDCLDKKSHFFNKHISLTAAKNRRKLRQVMMNNGFVPYQREWWHFTLRSEMFPDQYFNFNVQ